MTTESDSILGRKTAKRQPAKSRSSFSPAMLEGVSREIAISLSALFGARTVVAIESIGVEPCGDLIEAVVEPASAGIIELNGIKKAALVSFDPDLVFHMLDILLGGDPDAETAVSSRPASALDDRFCGSMAEAVIAALSRACNAAMGADTIERGALVSIEHDKGALALAPESADVLCVRTLVGIGQGGRTGALELHFPLTTIDLLARGDGDASPLIAASNGPWFNHMRDSVLEMELETIGILHTEKMSVAEISRLDIGTVIAVPGKAIEEMPLVLEDGGDLISSGELGSSSGRRIVRLADVPNQAFLDPLRQALD